MAKQVGRQLRGKVVIGLIIRSAIGLAIGLVIKLVVGVAVRVIIGVVVGSAIAIGEEIIKWDEEALDALFNKTIKYSIINNYIFAITELYIWQLKGKALQLLQGAKLSVVLNGVRRDKDWI